MYRRLK